MVRALRAGHHFSCGEFEQGNPLVGCVNQVLAEMKSDGTLKELKQKHLQQYLDVPALEK